MPKVKLTEKQTLEIKAKYESGALNNREIAEKYKISEAHVRKLARLEKWVKGKEKEYYDAKKITTEKEILAKFKPDKEEESHLKKISVEAQKDAKRIAETKLKIEAKEMNIRAKGIELLEGYVNDIMEVINNAKSSNRTVETFEYDEKGNLQTKNTISNGSKYKIMNELKFIDLLKGLGILQTTPSVAMQVNNTNSQQTNNDITTKEHYENAIITEKLSKYEDDVKSKEPLLESKGND